MLIYLPASYHHIIYATAEYLFPSARPVAGNCRPKAPRKPCGFRRCIWEVGGVFVQVKVRQHDAQLMGECQVRSSIQLSFVGQ